MQLKEFYKLRKDFTIIGLTGRIGTGSSRISEILSNPDFIKNIEYDNSKEFKSAEEIKFNMCYNFLSHEGNFRPYQIMSYKEVILLHVVFESIQSDDFSNTFINILCQNGEKEEYINRFDRIKDKDFLILLAKFLNTKFSLISQHLPKTELLLNQWLQNKNEDNDFIKFYFDEFSAFSNELYNLLNRHSSTKRTRFNHDVSNNLRSFGNCTEQSFVSINGNYEHIYTVAETINRLIKLWRKKNDGVTHMVIDSLKNSLELMYFKEKFSGFYMIAVNKSEDERIKYLNDKPEIKGHSENLIRLDYEEYKGDEVNKGILSSPDIENCIQKSDFHIYHESSVSINSEEREYNLEYQLIKLLALINQPGIVTPTPLERTMQIAYNAKFNSGCISRQVGAVITDTNFTVKSIGWNDVAQNQMPCKLRSIHDLANNENVHLYSDYELSGGAFKYEKENISFNDAVSISVSKANFSNLEGRNCSFCFKTYQNSFENEKNQVHTRSLHAEENAMLQLTKNGGMGVKGGYLFTTASPCELCSKKAFQLGITKVFYIDPYPGIAMQHTLKNGTLEVHNPKMFMFKGAVGRAFHKLYEPFMSYKDEIAILTNLKPIKIEDINEMVKNLTEDEGKRNKILKLLSEE